MKTAPKDRTTPQRIAIMMQAASSVDSSNYSSIGAADKKILADLDTLNEQVDLCIEILKENNGRPISSNTSDEALLGVIGFLEACAPRMVELIEAAAQGALAESSLNACLEVNDRLLKVLSDCENPKSVVGSAASSGGKSETPAVAPPAAKAESDFDIDLDDLLLDDKVGSSTATDPFGGSIEKNATVNNVTIDDVFGDNENAQKKELKQDDGFEDFFH